MNTLADVVIGGQAGSEGKGAITAYLARRTPYTGAVRAGGSNAGHTVYDRYGEEHVQQVIPSPGIVDENINLYVAADSFFSVSEILEEIERIEDIWNQDISNRLFIDPKAAIIEEKHKKEEREKKLGRDIASTVHGVGAAKIDKIWRSAGDITLAEDVSELSAYISDERVSKKLIDENYSIVEGTQGTLLSLNQSNHFPYTTSRDCTATSFLSSVGLPTSVVNDTWGVFRTYPIRVGGKSGDMDGAEVTFESIAERAGFEDTPVEFTSVTGKKRRIFEWSTNQFEQAMRLNHPDKIALTFIDYINADDYSKTEYSNLSKQSKLVCSMIESLCTEFNSSLSVLKTGEKPHHVINLEQ